MSENREYQNLRKVKGTMDNKSIKSIQEYNKSIKEWNIKMHKICIILLILINICLIGFLLVYKFQISSLSIENANQSKEIIIEEKRKKDYDSQIEHMLINMISNLGIQYSVSYFFKNFDDLNKVKDIILKSSVFTNVKKNEIHPLILTTSIYYSINIETFRETICWLPNILILIETDENKRFGIFWSSEIEDLNNENVTTYIKDKNAFMFSFDSGKIFKVKSNAEYSVYVPTEGDVLLNVGNGDLIIPSSAFSDGTKSKSNFPVSFESNGEVSNPFTSNGEIDIKEFEIYSILIYESS